MGTLCKQVKTKKYCLKGGDKMVTIYNVKKTSGENENPKFLVEVRCLAADEKPTSLENGEIENGSQLIEIDTQDVYLYDYSTKSWIIPSSGE